jgi:hypothetical protein
MNSEEVLVDDFACALQGTILLQVHTNLGFVVCGLWSVVWRLGFGDVVWDLGFVVWRLGFGDVVWDLGFGGLVGDSGRARSKQKGQGRASPEPLNPNKLEK